MKIALLAPAGAMHRYNGMFHKNLHYAPVTLSLLAALVPPELGADVKIYDETAGPIPLGLDADVAAMTCITGTAQRCYRYADYFRSRGITVLMGGVHPSLMPEEAAQHADSVFTGLAEETFPQALADLAAGRLRARYDEAPGTTVAGRPLPRRDLLNKKGYITLNTVEVIRGCNHRCSFCAYPQAFGSRLHRRPVEDIVAEIKTLRGKVVIFPDVNLTADPEYAARFFRAIAPLKKWWMGLTTSDISHYPELMDLMKKSGCRGLLIGLESVNQQSQADMRKGVNNVSEYGGLMRALHSRGIMVMGCFAFGSDADGTDVFARTVKLAEDAKIDLPRFSVITPFPRTPFYLELEAQGRITERDWALYDVEHVVFRPARMTAEQLKSGIAGAWKSAYSFKSIFTRTDWKNIFHIGPAYFIYLMANIGYRRYARRFAAYDDDMMRDNGDIPPAAGKGEV